MTLPLKTATSIANKKIAKGIAIGSLGLIGAGATAGYFAGNAWNFESKAETGMNIGGGIAAVGSLATMGVVASRRGGLGKLLKNEFKAGNLLAPAMIGAASGLIPSLMFSPPEDRLRNMGIGAIMGIAGGYGGRWRGAMKAQKGSATFSTPKIGPLKSRNVSYDPVRWGSTAGASASALFGTLAVSAHSKIGNTKQSKQKNMLNRF
jgi:uncharacterized membrane protein (Fun14 family)